MRDTCAICGAAIGENNHTGIGGGCMENVVKPAKWDCFNQVKGLDVWCAKVKVVKEKFLETFAETKFRSAFKKSFYESMKTAERVSRKQFDIMVAELEWKFIRFDLQKEIVFPLFEKFNPHYECEELYRERLEMHKKLYLSGRKGGKEEDSK